MALLSVISIAQTYAGVPVIQDISFEAAAQEVVCLLGPSGCGKTTLLRTIAGLEAPDGGRILLDGQDLADLPVHRRGLGLMFQDYALFPHKDVAGNVSFGLRILGLSADEIRERVAEVLELVGLSGYDRRRVFELSGGEQQRVALARSLAPRPRLLMLDEPLGSLDRALREELMGELRSILRRVGVTTLYVTHDQEEAFAVADRVVVMRQGRIVQQGAPQEVYRHPADSWVARFLGLNNLLPGRVTALDPVEVETTLGLLEPAEATGVEVGQTVTVLIRPEAARPAAECPEAGGLRVEGVMRGRSFRGGHTRVTVGHRSGVVLTVEMVSDGEGLPEPGEPIALVLRPESIGLLAR